MAKTTNTEGTVKKNPLAKFAKSVGTQRLIALLALILIYVVFGFINPAFRSYATLVNIFDASYYIGLMLSALLLPSLPMVLTFPSVPYSPVPH